MIEIAPVNIATPNVSIGLTLPFIGTSGNLFPVSYTTEQQAVSNLKNLLLTRQGERVMQPLFGTRLWEVLFEQNTDAIKEKVQDYILTAIDFWLPYIIVKELKTQTVVANSSTDNEEHGITISLTFSVTELGSNIPLTFLVMNNNIEVI